MSCDKEKGGIKSIAFMPPTAYNEDGTINMEARIFKSN